MTGPVVGGVLAPDGGRQDPADFTEWDRTEREERLAAFSLAVSVMYRWDELVKHIPLPDRVFLQRDVDAFRAAHEAHRDAVRRHYAARGL